MRTESKVWILVISFVALFAFGLYSAFRPESYPLKFIRGEVRPLSENLIVGPYPSQREIQRLRDDLGVNVLVSLMDPSSKIEGGFVREEMVLAKKYGMEFRNYPMDFMHLGDKSNKKQAASLVRYILNAGDKDKKYYVHCYLGRHRVGMFKETYEASQKAPRPANTVK